MGSVRRHSRSHCEQEASDDGGHTRTCPALYSRAIVLDLAEIFLDGPRKTDQCGLLFKMVFVWVGSVISIFLSFFIHSLQVNGG